MRNWFSRILSNIAQWLKKEDQPEVAVGTAVVAPALPHPVDNNGAPEDEMQRAPVVGSIAIIVGHNKSSKGAVNYLHESEYVFNSRVAYKLAAYLASEYSIESKIFYRRSDASYTTQCLGVAKECRRYGARIAVSLHFNSAGSRSALGCEVLIPKTATPEDNKLADTITDILNEELGIRERRDDGVYEISKGHRGSGMLYAVHNAGVPCCLVEPCFADYRTKESTAIFEEEDRYIRLLARAIAKQ